MSSTLLDNINDVDPSWTEFFEENIKILENISTILENKDEYLPTNDNIFSIFSKIKLQDIKVVIIGKEPYCGFYNNEPITDGMAFSMNDNIDIYDTDSRIPSELKVVFSGLKKVNNTLKFETFSLDKWVEQGVFLLNTCFTVNKFKPNSHIQRNFWKPFIFKLIKKICETVTDCVFLIWGTDATFISSYISNSCTKYTSDYPSQINSSKFRGHVHMIDCNKYLEKRNKKPINWST